MASMVLLQHALPDGSSHYDWLIEQREPVPGEDTDIRCLLSFRVAERPDDPLVRAFPATRLDDHRLRYLTYEGDIGGEHGRVSRVAHGIVYCVAVELDRVRIEGRFEGHSDRAWTALHLGPRWFVQAWDRREERSPETSPPA
jgi:hypothetical protein